MRNTLGEFALQREEYCEDPYISNHLQLFEKGSPQQNFIRSSLSYYWESDEKWGKIVSAIDEQNIFVVKGDLFNRERNCNLISALEQNTEYITVFDISNIPDDLDNRKLIADVLESFPFDSEQPIVLSTTRKKLSRECSPTVWPKLAGEPNNYSMWNYTYSPVDEYLKFLRSN